MGRNLDSGIAQLKEVIGNLKQQQMISDFLSIYGFLLLSIFILYISIKGFASDYIFYKNNNWNYELKPPGYWHPSTGEGPFGEPIVGKSRFYTWAFFIIVGFIFFAVGIRDVVLHYIL